MSGGTGAPAYADQVSQGEYAAAYQGAPGAFSEAAALHVLGSMEGPGEGGPRLLPSEGFADVFDAVESGRARFGVVPVENTLVGSVVAVEDLLRRREVWIVGEAVLRIVHHVAARPGASLAGVRRVLSHPVALAQCEGFFRRHPWLEAVPVYDTAGAMERVLAGDRLDEAALGSARAAELHGAAILASGVEDDPANFTRFLALAREPDAGAGKAGRAKTSLLLTLPHRPGSLCAALAAFAARGLNLTRIESRPLLGRPFEYGFAIDLAEESDPAAVEESVAELRQGSAEVRLLGRFPILTEPV